MLVASAGCQLDWSLETPAADDGGHVALDGGAATDAGDGALDGALDCTGALVCTDFADGSVTPPFAQTFNAPGGTLRVDLDASAPPHGSALYVMRPGMPQNPDTTYGQTPLFSSPYTEASLAVDVLPVQISSATGHACVLGITVNEDSATEHVVRLLVGTNDAILQYRVTTPDGSTFPLSQTLPSGQWTRVTLSVTAAGHVTLRFDGETVLDTALGALGSSLSPVRAFIGINFTDETTSAYAFRFDDVRFAAQ